MHTYSRYPLANTNERGDSRQEGDFHYYQCTFTKFVYYLVIGLVGFLLKNVMQ